MLFLTIFHIFNIALGFYLLVFGLFTAIITPFFINLKFTHWHKHIEKQTFYVMSDLNPYSIFTRTVMYSNAALSEKYAQKNFGTSQMEFRSKLNLFEVFLCYIAVSIEPIFIWSLIYFFAVELSGYNNILHLNTHQLLNTLR